MTIDLSNYSHYSHYIFCQNDDKQRINKINVDIKLKCKANCPDSCNEVMFLANYKGYKTLEKQTIFMNFEQGYYQIIKYLANMTFLQLAINIANVFNAWHGLSFNMVLSLFTLISGRFPRFNFSQRYRIIIKFNELYLLFKPKFKVSINFEIIQN